MCLALLCCTFVSFDVGNMAFPFHFMHECDVVTVSVLSDGTGPTALSMFL